MFDTPNPHRDTAFNNFYLHFKDDTLAFVTLGKSNYNSQGKDIGEFYDLTLRKIRKKSQLKIQGIKIIRGYQYYIHGNTKSGIIIGAKTQKKKSSVILKKINFHYFPDLPENTVLNKTTD